MLLVTLVYGHDCKDKIQVNKKFLETLEKDIDTEAEVVIWSMIDRPKYQDAVITLKKIVYDKIINITRSQIIVGDSNNSSYRKSMVRSLLYLEAILKTIRALDISNGNLAGLMSNIDQFNNYSQEGNLSMIRVTRYLGSLYMSIAGFLSTVDYVSLAEIKNRYASFLSKLNCQGDRKKFFGKIDGFVRKLEEIPNINFFQPIQGIELNCENIF